MSLYAIYNADKKKFRPHYNSRYMPALYQSRSTAQQILGKAQRYGDDNDYTVVKVELVLK